MGNFLESLLSIVANALEDQSPPQSKTLVLKHSLDESFL